MHLAIPKTLIELSTPDAKFQHFAPFCAVVSLLTTLCVCLVENFINDYLNKITLKVVKLINLIKCYKNQLLYRIKTLVYYIIR